MDVSQSMEAPKMSQDIRNMQLLQGINLSLEEFEKASKINKGLQSYNLKDENEASIVVQFKQLLYKNFSYGAKVEKLQLKDPVNINKVSCYAARFAKKRPLLFLFFDLEKKEFMLIDEKRFDAFDKGPFQKATI